MIIEKLPENKTGVREILLDLKQKIQSVEDPGERQGIIRLTFQSLKRSQLAIVDAQLRRGIDLPAAFTPDEQREMRQGIADARAKLTELGEALETWYKPETWSPETKQRMVALGWGAGIGIGVIALALLWRAARKKTAEVAKATGEKVGWLWGKVKWIVGLSLAGGLGYIGFRSYQEFMKLTALRNQLDAVVKKAAAATGRVKEVLEQEAQNLKAAITALETKGAQALAERSTVVPTTETVKETGRKAAAAVQGEAKKTTENSQTREIARAAVENVQGSLFARGLLLFEPAAETWTATDSTKQTQLTDIIDGNRDLDIQTVLNATSQPFHIKGNDRPNREQAALYLWNFCKKHGAAAERKQPKDGNRPLTLEGFLRRIAETYAAAIPVAEVLSTANGNMVEAMGKFDTATVVTGSQALRQTLQDYVHESMVDAGFSDKELSEIQWTDLVEIFTTANGTIGGSTLRGEGTSSKVLQRLYEKLQHSEQTDVHKYMLPFFHRVLPNAIWNNKNQEKNLQQIHTYLTQCMPVHQALRIAFYAHLIAKGNPVGIVLMQAEILRYIAKEEDSFFSIKKNTVMVRMVETLTKLGSDKLTEEWAQLQINVDPTITERGLAILKVAGKQGMKTTLAGAAGGVIETGKTGLALSIEHPAEATLAALGGMEIARQLSRHWTPYGHRMTESIKSFKDAYETERWYKDWMIQWRGISSNDIPKALDGWQKLYKHVSELPDAQRATRVTLLRQMTDCAKSIKTQPAWNTMLAFAKSEKLDDIAALVEGFAHSSGWQRVVAAQRPLPTQLPIISQVMKAYDQPSGAFWRMLGRLNRDEISGMNRGAAVLNAANQASNAAPMRSVDASVATAEGKVNVDIDIKPNVAAKTETVAAEIAGDTSKTAQGAKSASTATETLEQTVRTNKASAAAGTAETVGDASNAVRRTTAAAEALTKPAETARDFEKLYEEIRAARAAKDNSKLLELLRHSAELIRTEAAAGNRTAQGMLLVLRTVEAAKVAGKILLILGPLVDAALLIMNRVDMNAAQKANNMEMVRTLESKEKVLAGQGGVGLSMLLMTGPQALAVAPVAIASGVITGNIYDSIIQWETSSRQWLNETPEALKKKLEEREIGHMDSGHKYGVMTHPFVRPFANWGKTSAEVDSEELRKVEAVNQHVRQEILTAYFLKTLKLPAAPNETEAQYKQRAIAAVQDRLAFVRATTDGTYARGMLSDELFFGQAENYANLVSMQRTLDANGQQRVFSYEWNGTMEQLDLGALDYVRTPHTGNATKDRQRERAFLKTMHKYREQILVYSDAVLAMQTMAPSIAG